MKKTLLGALALLAALSTAQAATINGFSGVFAHTNWVLSPVDGTFSADADSVSMTTANDKVDSKLDYTVVIKSDGEISFDWEFSTAISPEYELAGFLLGGDFQQLTDNNNGADKGQIGSRVVLVEKGDVFGFSVWSVDPEDGRSTTRFFNFAFTGDTDGSTVPEPPALALAALLIAGLAAGRRQRSRR